MNIEKIQSLNILDEQIFSFSDRLKSIIGSDSIRTFAKKCEISDTIVRKYLSGSSEPTLSVLLNLANAGGVDVAWLATGEESAKQKKSDFENFTIIPDLNIKVAAGSGLVPINESDSIGKFILNNEWLRRNKLLNKQLAVFHVDGDSMEPTISDDDIALVSIKNDGWSGSALSGIYVLRVEDLLFIKRIQVDVIEGGIHIISDNPMYQRNFIKIDDSTESRIKVVAKVERILTRATAIK